MKPGDNVKVKPGILCPDNESFDISGWEGRIKSIEEEYIEIEWDSITLAQMPNDFIQESIDEGIEYTLMVLEEKEIDISIPRDTQEDVVKMQTKMEQIYSTDETDKRISKILKSQNQEVNEANLTTYYRYLKSNMKKPCILTGMEDFGWEEPYLIGGWDKKEYEELKKINPSFTDQFEYIEFNEEISEIGLILDVRRISDKKRFSLFLWDLVVIDKLSDNYQLISDYSYWMSNYR